MSQDNPNPQPPGNKPEPQPTSPRRRTQIQPFWKAQIIKLLRGTIGALEGAVEKLETEPAPGSKQTPGFWGGILGKIRSLLPENLSAKLSDTALTGIIAAISVILIWTTSTLVTNKPTEVATVPQVEETPSPTITTPPAEIIPEPQPPVEITPPAAEIPPPEPEPTPEPTPEPEPTPTPTPKLELTPEQQLIAAIENQVGEISDRFASGLIKSIQANFSTSNLTVKISDDWYTLKQSEQDKLAADIFQRSKELDFSHLEITDSQDKLIARNPVVGTEMVIFKRHA
ncbi:hypothetical protein NIES4075_40940 [Tolypothrix sp. NIES-4075]|uniref:hypothetical protein n=1 Tax=Tolypothrix sp. NIES-4075 TaxID=2005459 RepID=UPI000B5CD2CD|nr:hypothetical protein [Tolypothrix sp. NIES-4075]GAX43083.1 hypothetical protein NIES4075_40940 [Tolypothrix sp. NIES-4075]